MAMTVGSVMRWTKLMLAVMAAAGLGLAGQAYALQPITPLGSEVRVTQQGTDGDSAVDAMEPDVAYNPDRDEFLVVFTERDASGETDVWGRLTDGDGKPKGNAVRIGQMQAAGFQARDPVVTYDPGHKRYAVAYIGTTAVGPPVAEDLFIRLVTADGTLVPGACSLTFAGSPCVQRTANDPVRGAGDIVYDSVSDSFVVAYTENQSGGSPPPDAYHVFVDAFASADLAFRTGRTASPNDSSIFEASLVARSDPTYPVVLAWTGANAGKQSIFVERTEFNGLASGDPATGKAISATQSSFGPTLATNPGNGQILVGWHAADPAMGNEVFVQRLAGDLTEIGADDQRVSCAGADPACTGVFQAVRPAVAFESSLQRWFVAWGGSDVNRTGGIADTKNEVMGQLLDADGNEVGADDFVVSNHGAPNATLANVLITVPVVALGSNNAHRWLAFWAGDFITPTADEEYELYSRAVGENFDFDGDGSSVPQDCNDGNASVHPGAVDVPGNGVDEDCSGADAISPGSIDADGDGVPTSRDCNDSNRAIKPGATEIRGNKVDENCDGRADPFGTLNASPSLSWDRLRSGRTRIKTLVVEHVVAGDKVKISCLGKGCRKGANRTITVKRRQRTLSLTKYVKGMTLRPGVKLTVQISRTGYITRIVQYTTVRRRDPKKSTRCLTPGQKIAKVCRA